MTVWHHVGPHVCCISGVHVSEAATERDSSPPRDEPRDGSKTVDSGRHSQEREQ